MYEQHSIRWIELLRAPRVGIAALGIGIVAAFVAGAVVVSLLAGSHTALSAQVAVSSGQRVTMDEVLESRLLAESRLPVVAPAAHPGLTVEDLLESRLLAESRLPVVAPAAHSGLTVEDLLESRLLAESRLPVPAPASQSGSR
jgi:hypothetical protein